MVIKKRTTNNKKKKIENKITEANINDDIDMIFEKYLEYNGAVAEDTKLKINFVQQTDYNYYLYKSEIVK